VDAAVKHANREAEDNSIRKCAQYVRQALEAGGFYINPNDRPDLAKDYGPHLEKAGFHRLSPRPRPDYDAQKGDVVVIQSHTEVSRAGHIAIFNGKHWVSDFVQEHDKTIWPGPGYRKFKPDYEVYRP
jgi:hypothetical protein